MSLHLDQRHRAMLAEMGVKVWTPEAPLPAPPAGSLEEASPPAGQDVAPAVREAVTRPAAATTAPAQPVARALPADLAAMDWDALQQAVASCQACALCQSRRQTVFGVGHTQARWLVVGEAPGEQEDLQGEPFVGQAGQLLDNMLKAIGLDRRAHDARAVYIANVLKCRPPANRNPLPQEVLQCEPYLRRQVALLQPSIILALGRFAAQSLLRDSVPDIANLPLARLRGQVHHYAGIPVIVSYHPAYLLRTPQDKAKAWADLCLARALMSRPLH
jgi:DNA polymerase